MRRPVIMCVDDEKILLNSLKDELYISLKGGYDIVTVDKSEEAVPLFMEILDEGCDIPLVISDYVMPVIKGDMLLKEIHSISPQTLKIMLTGQADVNAVGNAVNYAGLYRYINKPWDRKDLSLTVQEALKSYFMEKQIQEKNRHLAEMNIILEQKVIERTRELEQKVIELTEIKKKLEETNARLDMLSLLDALTEIPNRRSFNNCIDREWKRALREGSSLSVIIIDIDYFKKYNDHYGHLAGDDCLIRVAKSLVASVKRPGDFIARYGGEEFVAILPNTDNKGAINLAEQMKSGILSMSIPHCESGLGIVTISMGLATKNQNADVTLEQFLKMADDALYEAKASGRNGYK